MFTILRFIPQRKVLLFLGDLLIVIFSVPLSYIFLTGHISNFANLLLSNPWVYLLLVGIWMVLLFLNRAYHINKITDFEYNSWLFLRVAVFSTLILGFLYSLIPDVVFSQRVMIGHGFFILALAMLWRAFFSYIVTRPRFKSPVIVVGAGPAGELIAQELLHSENFGFQLVGFIDDDIKGVVKLKKGKKVSPMPVLGRSKDLIKIVRGKKVRVLVDAVRGNKGGSLLQALSALEMGQIRIIPMHHLYEYLTARIPIKHVEGEWLVFDEFHTRYGLREVINRVFNFSAATVGIILAGPIMLLTALAIKLESPGPLIYKQKRVGQGGREFMVYKFRSMGVNAEKGKAVWAKTNDPRVTKTGKIIRKLRIDEIPQLVNIWKGDMNLVGPRPERPEFVMDLEKVIPFYQKRHLVKPGVTGWAQVKYTYGSTTHDALEKLQYDLYYIKRRSFILDLIIIIKTVDVVLTGRGAK